MKLKAARLAAAPARRWRPRACWPSTGRSRPRRRRSIVRGLAIDLLNGAHDVGPAAACLDLARAGRARHAGAGDPCRARLVTLRGDAHLARDWLLPIWERAARARRQPAVKLVSALEEGSTPSTAPGWRASKRRRSQSARRDLQYLAGMACMKRQLWGKAQQLLTQALLGLQDARLHRNAWRALAELAEERGDADAAATAWKQAAQD
jgi:HemY protein